MASGAWHWVSSRLAAGLLLTSLLAPLGTAQPWEVCGNSGNRAANSIYQANLGQLSAALPTNASGPLFAKAAVGAAPEVAYALALCRGDSNAPACESCISSAFQDALRLCPYSKDAALYLDNCSVRFSNENFLATSDNGRPVMSRNPQTVISSVEEFDAAVRVLLNATADYAVNSFRRFATGEEASHSGNLTIYGLAQCTPDMPQADCRICLQGIIMFGPEYLSGRQGGRIDGVRCNFRYELNNKFFTGAPTLRLQNRLWLPPVPAPKNVTKTPTTTPGGES